jgi:glucosylceramidase
MNARPFRPRKWLTAMALPLANTVAGCHGGEMVFDTEATDPCRAPTCSVVSSAEDAYWTANVPVVEVTTDTADVTVDEGAVAQIWEGFGGAFNERGWSYLTAHGLQDEALTLLFGEEGCRFVFGRIPIGANDYAMDRYTLDETPGDYPMEHFSIDRDRQRLIPYVEAALAVNPNIRFWACPWTPPTWMKTGEKTVSTPSPFDGGSMRDDDAILEAYARYLTRFASEYGAEGITIDVVSPQNEPSYEQPYPSCRWTPALYTKFIGAHLGPALEAAGLSTKVMLGTLSDDSAGPEFAASVRDDPVARRFIGVIGMQWDMLDVVTDMTPQMQGLPLWQTEHQAGNYPWNPEGSPPYQPTAPNDHAYAVESWGLIRDWIKAGVTAYYAWNMVLDKTGQGLDTATDWAQNALLVVDGARLIKTPTYYVFRHLSQFVAPRARVLGSTGGDALAFENPDGSIVTVVYNRDAAKRFVVAVGGKKLAFDMPGDGWATVRYAR